jgi:hypothetical protein
MAYGLIPTACRQVKVKFIPKPGKLDYTSSLFSLENDGKSNG